MQLLFFFNFNLIKRFTNVSLFLSIEFCNILNVSSVKIFPFLSFLITLTTDSQVFSFLSASTNKAIDNDILFIINQQNLLFQKNVLHVAQKQLKNLIILPKKKMQ